MPDVYPRFGPVTTPSGTFGYIRLATFAPAQAATSTRRGQRVRPDPSYAAPQRPDPRRARQRRRLYQFRRASPADAHVRGRSRPSRFISSTTALTLRLARSRMPWLNEWAQPLATAHRHRGRLLSGLSAHPSRLVQRHRPGLPGPRRARSPTRFCYSTTDIFAAGFQDHQIGTILGCHDNTGAGGANVWDYHKELSSSRCSRTRSRRCRTAPACVSPCHRSTRVGAPTGVPLEDLGARARQALPHHAHQSAEATNVDLIAAPPSCWKDRPTQALAVAPAEPRPTTQVIVHLSQHQSRRRDGQRAAVAVVPT